MRALAVRMLQRARSIFRTRQPSPLFTWNEDEEDRLTALRRYGQTLADKFPDHPAMREKIETILSGRSVNH